jgi:hypothetical protein
MFRVPTADGLTVESRWSKYGGERVKQIDNYLMGVCSSIRSACSALRNNEMPLNPLNEHEDQRVQVDPVL